MWTDLLALAACGAPDEAGHAVEADWSPPDPPMNIVLIVADTLRRDRMSPYGALRTTMPHFEARMEHTARYDRVFATSNWTLPSTTSILTGAIAERTGIDFAVNAEGGYVQHEMKGASIVPQLTDTGRRAGFFSGNLGLDYVEGLEQGFDAFEFMAIGEEGSSEPLVDRALEWVDEGEEPFLLYVQPFDTHFPYIPPPEVRGTFRDPDTIPFALTKDAETEAIDNYRSDGPEERAETLAALLDLYDEELLFLDMQIERLLVGLAERGRLDESVVVLTADHGELFDDGGSGLFFHGVSLRPGVNIVPLLFYGPELEPATSDALVSGVDVLPTIFSMVGETVPPTPDGISLFANSKRQRAYTWDPVGLGWGPEIPPTAALTDGRWKVSRDCPGVARGYDLSNDPEEAYAFDPTTVDETEELLVDLRTRMVELHPECP